MLYVNSVLHRLALGDRRLGEILATAEFLQDARALVFTFELLQGAFDVFGGITIPSSVLSADRRYSPVI